MNKLRRLAALPFIPCLAGCSTLRSIGGGMGILLEFLLYLAAIALPFVLGYYLSKD